MEIPVYGRETHRLDKESGFAYTVSTIYNNNAPKHTHNFYEMFVVSEGNAYHFVNNSVQTITKGDFFFVRPSDVHCYNFYHSENFCNHNLGFTRQVFQNVSLFLEQSEKLEKLVKADFPMRVHVGEKQLERILDYMREMGELLEKGSLKHAKYHGQCIVALLLEEYFFTYDENEAGGQIPAWLSELLSEMSRTENLQEGYPRMLRMAPCSSNHLCRLMKQTYGQTPTQFINRQRLKYAVYLLMQTDREILDICEACGFSNLSHFYHLFKAQFGVAPAKFRKEEP